MARLCFSIALALSLSLVQGFYLNTPPPPYIPPSSRPPMMQQQQQQQQPPPNFRGGPPRSSMSMPPPNSNQYHQPAHQKPRSRPAPRHQCVRGRSQSHPSRMGQFSAYYPEAPRCSWPSNPMRSKKPPQTTRRRRPSSTSASSLPSYSAPFRSDVPMKLPTVQQIFVREVAKKQKEQQQQQQQQQQEEKGSSSNFGETSTKKDSSSTQHSHGPSSSAVTHSHEKEAPQSTYGSQAHFLETMGHMFDHSMSQHMMDQEQQKMDDLLNCPFDYNYDLQA